MREPGQPKLTRRQQRELERQTAQSTTPDVVAQRNPMRLKLLALIGAGAVALGGGSLLAAPYIRRTAETYAASQELEAKRNSAGKKYEGALDLKGQNFLDSYTLTEQMTALKDAGHPLLTKTHAQLVNLLKPERHPEFDSWVSEVNSPLPVLENQTTTASVSFRFKEHPTEYAYTVLPDGSGIRIKKAEDMVFAISLPRSPLVKASSPLAQSIFLAKEAISLALVLGHARDYDKMVEAGKEATFTDENRQPLTDPASKQEAGRTLFNNQTRDLAGPLNSVIDGFPILLLAPVVRNLKQRGLLLTPADQAIIGSFEDADKVIGRGAAKGLDQKVRSFTNDYLATPNFVPGIEILNEISRGDLVTASMEVHQQTIRAGSSKTK